jgi:formate hydrogenlyase subunit 3/multisubunit Na+/H+ antiporter MnhD subunit
MPINGVIADFKVEEHLPNPNNWTAIKYIIISTFILFVGYAWFSFFQNLFFETFQTTAANHDDFYQTKAALVYALFITAFSAIVIYWLLEF